MSKLFYCALFVALTTLWACSGRGDEFVPNRRPNRASQPPWPRPRRPRPFLLQPPLQVEIPAPTEVPAPTDSPMPTPTDVPSETTPESGTLVPLDMNDPEAFMSQLSSDEQSCILETGDPGRC